MRVAAVSSSSNVLTGGEAGMVAAVVASEPSACKRVAAAVVSGGDVPTVSRPWTAPCHEAKAVAYKLPEMVVVARQGISDLLLLPVVVGNVGDVPPRQMAVG